MYNSPDFFYNNDIIKKLNNYFSENYGMSLKDKAEKIFIDAGLNVEKLLNNNDYYSKKILFDNFFKYYSVNETYFFREYLTEILINILNENDRYQLEIWSCGCSTGCEAFSIAMLLKYFEPDIYFNILASDINPANLEMIKAGGAYTQREMEAYKYTESEYNELLYELTKKNFHSINNAYYVNDEIKNCIETAEINLIDFNAGLYYNKFDIVFCRNVLFYFNDSAWKKTMDKIYKTIKPGGAFVVSPYESAAKKLLEYFKFARVKNLKGIYYFIK